MTVSWQTILDDASTALTTINAGIDVGAALGVVPDAAIVVPLLALAATVTAKLDALSKGNLTALQAAVGTVDATIAAEIAAKWPPGSTGA